MKLSLVLFVVLAVFGIHQVQSVPVHSRGLSQGLKDFLAFIPKEQVTKLFFPYLSEDEEFGEAVDYFMSRNLKDDLEDFLKLIPQKAIEDLFYEYLAEDEDFGEAIDYILSDEFKKLVIDVENMPEVRGFLNFLEQSGLDAYEFVNKLNKLLGIDKISPLSKFKTRKITGGLPGFIKDVMALLPLKEIEALYKKKLETSKDFAKLVERLMSKEFQGLVDRIMDHPTMKDLIKRAEAKGVDVNAIFEFITKIFGIKFPQRPVFFLSRNIEDNLVDDLKDFLALVPFDKIKDLYYAYLAKDKDFVETVDYLHSDEFRGLVMEVERLKEVKSFLEFLKASGFDAYSFVNKFNDYIGIDHITPTNFFKVKPVTGGFPGFTQDAMALLPLKEIEALYNKKLETSKDFAKLVERLMSKEFQGLVDRIKDHPTMKDLMKRAEAKDFDVKAVLEFITKMFGMKFPVEKIA